MARPSRSKRKVARARERGAPGDETSEFSAAAGATASASSRRNKALRRGPAKAAPQGSQRRSVSLQNAHAGSSEGVPVVAKVGLAAIAILLVLYLVSRTR
jgi:hypothetical protein